MDSTTKGVISGLFAILTIFAAIWAFDQGFKTGQEAGKAWIKPANKAPKK
jgi:hypothetical protein